mgnify:CR=1 FL=1
MAGKPTPGVRGPGGPSNEPTPKASRRSELERRSFPMLAFFTRVPKWLLIVTMAGLLFAGFVFPVAWVGGILLLLVVAFLVWLVLLSWPVLNTSSKLLRVIVIVALLGVTYFRFIGKI